MDCEGVWEKFLPKKRKGNFSSGLSQLSLSSSISTDCRLSLANRALLRDSFQVDKICHESTPSKPSTSITSSCLSPTPGPSPKTRTPSTKGKRSSKKSTPSDGKTQTSLHSYFPTSATKKAENFQVRSPEVEEITLSSDDEEGRNVLGVKTKENVSERNRISTAGVSRVLFPESSTTPDNDSEEVLAGTQESLSPAPTSDKENHLLPSITLPGSKKSVVNTIENPSKTTNISINENCSKLPNEDAATAGRSIYKKKQSAVASSAIIVESEAVTSMVRTSVVPSPDPVADIRLDNLVKNTANQPNLQDKLDKGKKKMDTFAIPNDYKGREVSNKGFTKRTKVHSKQSAANTSHSSLIREKSHCMTPSNITHMPSTSRDGQSQNLLQCQSAHEPLENFTGVTECFTMPSSGELWTPGNYSSSSSSAFDEDHITKPVTSKRLSAKKNGVKGKRKQTKNEKCKRVVSKSSSTSKPVRMDKMKRTGIGAVQHTPKGKSTANTNDFLTVTSASQVSSPGNISQATTVQRECFSNSGGFFPEDENLERPSGQAYVIRSPSMEYLEDYELFDDSTVVVENNMGESGSDQSSVLADLNDIDVVASSSGNQADLGEGSGEAVVDVHSQTNYSATTLPVDMQSLDYQNDLKGVTLTDSEWDKLPSHLSGNQVSRMINQGVVNTSESSASIPLSCVMRNATQDSTFTCQSWVVRGKQSSQDLLTERAVSPNVGEEAPCNDVIAGSRHSAHQPGANSNAVMSPDNGGMSSQSTDIQLTSVIAPIDPPHIQNVSPNKEDYEERLASKQKVLNWISKSKLDLGTGYAIPIREFSFSQEAISPESELSASDVAGRSDSIEILENKTKDAPPGYKSMIPTSENPCSVKIKACKILAQIQVFTTHSYKKQGGRVEVTRKNCGMKYTGEHKKDEFRKTSAVLTAEVFDISGDPNSQFGNSKTQLENDSNVSSKTNKKTDQLLKPRRNSAASLQDNKLNISVKANATYGKWGWKEIEIECAEEGNHDSNSLSEFSVLSIEKVCIKLCKCSRTLSVECIVVHNKLGLGYNSVEGSKFHTSLKDYESCWGAPDNQLTLSAVAYAEISSNKLAKDRVVSVNSSFEVESNLSDSLTTVSPNVNRRAKFKGVSGKKCQGMASRKGDSSPVPSDLSQLSSENDDSSLSGLATSSDTSDSDWMTQEGEASKKYTKDQWGPLMKKMRLGRTASESTPESISTSSYTASSSFISSSSQGTGSYRGQRGRARFGSEKRSKNCPFYKKIEGTRFAVDAFSYGSIPGITQYFLSHFHYDHYMGLNKNFPHHIYCSTVTAKLVTLQLKIKSELIRRIDPGETIKVEGVIVTALDANHCPGSLMLLFQLPEGRTHLHVGDFRAHLGMESYHAFWNVNIDQLYLDTTYCDPAYTFSCQERVIESVLSIVERAILKDPRTLIICGSYTIGKERVFAAITEKFHFKVWARAGKQRVLQCVREGLQELSWLYRDRAGVSEGGATRELNLIKALSMLSTVKEDAQVHILPMSEINGPCLTDHLFSIKANTFSNVVAFRPTGWTHEHTKGKCESNLIFNSNSVKVYEVAYSEHSSFQELARFVKFLKPLKVVKTVNVGSAQERKAMDVYIDSWLKEAHAKVPIPNKVSDSPRSFRVAVDQRKAGDFSKKKISPKGRRLLTSQESMMSLFASDMQKSSNVAGFTGSSLGLMEIGSSQNKSHIGAKKRMSSPLDM